ncbi:beta-glucosidase BglX [Caulobacter endophyticus]|uniref:Beta-D-glucoside glucohydrolase n=1 Tax=Caulobacter endophyticus TaxID=2172652 RepID=A0A2T9K3Q3_9CAUL|nr:beta-glucosidase BglX [Caulobacter endophyticus]PVM90609.1 beta-glucosidase BglX [Caulobacter endophyticus]
MGQGPLIDRRALLAAGAALGLAPVLPALAAGQDARVRDLLRQMTLDEKIGQTHQPAGGRQKALNSKIDATALDLVRKGGVGSYLHVAGAAFLRELQRTAVEESRLKIPLLFAIDVVHGFRTLYPVPLAMAATFDPEIVRATARMAAVETAVSGLHWTFAPMVDIARDPRWGRIVEGAGEDPYLGSVMAAAQVRGFQGEGLAGKDSILACAKHFGAYGAAAGGRDYDSAELSDRTLNEVYLPPFHAAAKAGAGTMMTAFNDLNGEPTTANAALVRGVLKTQWTWPGLVVSDWNAILELINHGVAETPVQAAALALKAGVDMDMASGVYAAHLKTAIAQDPSLLPLLDQAVTRILTAKMRLGLFDDPYRFGDPEREKTIFAGPEHRAIAREAARKAVVLLKNDGGLLPIAPTARKIAVVGALATDSLSQLGSWKARGQVADVAPLLPALKAAAPAGTEIVHVAGAGPRSDDETGIPAAVEAARAADLVLLMVGEDFDHSGESRSRSDLSLPGAQGALARAVLATGKPVVVLLPSGRPLVAPEVLEKAPAVLATWFLGVEAGPALADILFGKSAPGGRLPVGFPRATGQSPTYYAHVPTGRPADPDLAKDTVRYHDVDIGPLFPFGHGLSYAAFAYSDLALDRESIAPTGAVKVSMTLTNTGALEADEVVQLYVRDPLASVARPVKELRGFVRVTLKPGEKRRVTFTLSAAQLAIWSPDGWRIEAGKVEVMVGSSSADIRLRGAFTIAASGKGRDPAAAILTPVGLA